MYEDYFKRPMSALATVAGKSLKGEYTAKIDSPIAYFMLLLMLIIGSLKSLHKLFDEYLYGKQVKSKQNHIVETIRENFEHFEKVLRLF